MRTEVEKGRVEVAKAEANIIKWNVGAIIVATSLSVAIARLFFTGGASLVDQIPPGAVFL
ncbi:MAG: hypothetical protein LBR95_00315 [Azoarcus sp.]|nr:hypothetical protein [Azoarcus sp.]